jgi:hydroxyethylthiazole kinase-like uncharacterized protein yjeF
MRNLFEEVGFLDRRCYDVYGLSEDILMEHAASALVQEVKKRKPRSVLIVAGPGNNGGDGVAAARQLLGECEVKLFMPYGAKSAMCKLQLERFYALGGVLSESVSEADVVIDALFGSGLRKPLKEDAVTIVERLNGMEAFIIACDIPSGLDAKGNPLPVAVKADITVTMGALKLALFSDYAKDYVGEVAVADLGVSRERYEIRSEYQLLERSDLKPPYRVKEGVNKGTFGHLAVIAGEKEGAAIMAALAALRYGAGLVTVVRNEPFVAPYELMHSNSLPPKCTALAVGMGLGLEYSDAEFAELVLACDKPMVIDADLFYSQKILKLLERDNVVLTPHPKEFSSLLTITGVAEASVEEIQRDRVGYALKFCQKYPQAVLVLKGANPIIAKEKNIYINPLGTNALAKGGSGDILTGLIGALLAQGYEPLEAAIQGSLAHAIASQKVDVANYALTPSDLLSVLGRL